MPSSRSPKAATGHALSVSFRRCVGISCPFGIVAEAHRLAGKASELIILAQDSSRYAKISARRRIGAPARNFRTEGIRWVRVMYTYPTHISDGFLDVLAEEPKAVKYLDMPLQHASECLKLMKRGGNRASLGDLSSECATRAGDAVRTTFITGTGETEEDFAGCRHYWNVEFDRVGVFTYSDEEGTPAYDLPNKVEPRIAKQRRARLMKNSQDRQTKTQDDDWEGSSGDLRR